MTRKTSKVTKKQVTNSKNVLLSRKLGPRGSYWVFAVVALFSAIALAAHPIITLIYFSLLAILVLIIIPAIFIKPFLKGAMAELVNRPNKNRPTEINPLKSSGLEENEYKVSSDGYFTYLPPGFIKAITREGRFQRFIMSYEGYTFRGEIPEFGLRDDDGKPTYTNPKYWDVIKVTAAQENLKEWMEDENGLMLCKKWWSNSETLFKVKNKSHIMRHFDPSKHRIATQHLKDAHPILDSLALFKNRPLWYWSRFVYRFTGGVFTGIPGYQIVDTYEFQRFSKVSRSSGKSFVRKIDFSDNLRAQQFQFFVLIDGAEAGDAIQLNLVVSLYLKVINPYQTFYETDKKWPERVTTAVNDVVGRLVRSYQSMSIISEGGNTAYEEEKGLVTNSDEFAKSGSFNKDLVDVIMNLNTGSVRYANTTMDDVKTDKGLIKQKSSFNHLGLEILDVNFVDVAIADEEVAKAVNKRSVAQYVKTETALLAEGQEEAIKAISRGITSAGDHFGERIYLEEARIRQLEAINPNSVVNIDFSGNGKNTIDNGTALLNNTLKQTRSDSETDKSNKEE